MKVKICGMKYNTLEVAALNPDFLGFIFWEGSARHYTAPSLPLLPEGILPVGVFVDAGAEAILEHVQNYGLQAVQLHGTESPAYCRNLRTLLVQQIPYGITLIKAFSVGVNFEFGALEDYLPVCDMFLFDTKGELPGGTGKTFDWEVLGLYPYQKPFLLSGGIGEAHCSRIQEFLRSPKSKYCMGIDVNSKFEKAPGLKDTEALGRFLECGIWETRSTGAPNKH